MTANEEKKPPLPKVELPFIREEDWAGAFIGVTAQQAIEDMVLLSAERIKAHEAGADLE